MNGAFKFYNGEVINLDYVVSIGEEFDRDIGEWQDTEVSGFFGKRKQRNYVIVRTERVFYLVLTPSPYPSVYDADQRKMLVEAFTNWKVR